ncbi:hypothetical protein GCM10009867_21070 [Pedococcus aerophilus]|uniref:Uncharacterized protein n=1 Tax=Pedococcus aerophilus TaxID=436356 RepID=A0ABP6H5B1_9MICO
MAWVPAEDDGTTWGYSLLNRQDWVYPEEGATQGECQMVAADGRVFEVHYFSGDDVKIELSEEAFAALGQFPRYLRSLGLGRLRKDHSLGLMPPADRIWIQSVHDNATLVVRPAGAEPGFFILGPLGLGALRMARAGMVSVLFFVGTDVLPAPSMRKEARAATKGRAWGGVVACTDAAPDASPTRGTAWDHHGAGGPRVLLEGVDAARVALEQSRQQRSPD